MLVNKVSFDSDVMRTMVDVDKTGDRFRRRNPSDNPLQRIFAMSKIPS